MWLRSSWTDGRVDSECESVRLKARKRGRMRAKFVRGKTGDGIPNADERRAGGKWLKRQLEFRNEQKMIGSIRVA